ncbi:AAA family ATPase [Oceanobacillus iheyensis]|uniref:AAA family ATPase n=1 Tax=Oceanobacillus iheyensis TaxID=182710 RepID=UPI0036320246
MIIWINGTFGVGKTETAKILHKRIPNSYLYDPEEVGFLIRKQLPVELCEEDFQDHEEWRMWNYHLLKKVTTKTEKVVIVPMTLTNEQYYQEIIGRLKKEGIQLHHFTLVAEPLTIIDRLKKRGDEDNKFIVNRIEKNVKQLDANFFQRHINTEKLTAEETASEVLNIIISKCL